MYGARALVHQPPPCGGRPTEGSPPMMAIDDLLDRGRDARRRRDEAANELAAVPKALEGLAGVELLDATKSASSRACASGRAASGPAGGEHRCRRAPSVVRH